MAQHLQSRGPLAWLALPVVPAYWLVSNFHRLLYAVGIKKRRRVAAPVVVVGNITVGGTGKSPLVRAIAEELVVRGYRPGIALRGYGGTARDYPQNVTPASDPAEVGDEAVEHAELSGVPVMVDPVRSNAADELISTHRCNVILLDDGLQHHAIDRDVEIAVIDGQRGFGNGWLLPAGPLRERQSRLKSVDHVVVNGARRDIEHKSTFKMKVSTTGVSNLADPGEVESFAALKERKLVAVTAVGNPDRIHQALHDAGIDAARRDFPDHHRFTPDDLDVDADHDIVVTGKDAVKLATVLDDHPLKSRVWRLHVTVDVDAKLFDAIEATLNRVTA